MPRPRRIGDGALRFVSVGRALPEHEVRIVDEAGSDVPERTVGRLVFRGPSDDRRATSASRRPRPRSPCPAAGSTAATSPTWRTARSSSRAAKDLIIKAGRNLVPQEIEEVAASVDGIRRGCVVAFGVAERGPGRPRAWWWSPRRAQTRRRARDRLAAAVTERVADRRRRSRPTSSCWRRRAPCRRRRAARSAGSTTRDLYLRGPWARTPRTALWRSGCASSPPAARAEARPRLESVARVAYAAYLRRRPSASWLSSRGPSRRSSVRGAPSRFLGAPRARLALRLAGLPPLDRGGASIWPARGPVLLASNHTSYVDVPALARAPARDFVFVAKKEIARLAPRGPLRPPRRAPHRRSCRRSRRRRRAGQRRRAPSTRRVGPGLPRGAPSRPPTGLRPFRLGRLQDGGGDGDARRPRGAARARARSCATAASSPRPGPIHVWVGRPVAPKAPAGAPSWSCATAWPTPSPPTAASRASTSWPPARRSRDGRRRAGSRRTTSRRARETSAPASAADAAAAARSPCARGRPT